jgi:hypothetical protein
MHNNVELKEWYNKREILEIYPIGVTTYKKRIKKLKSPEYDGKTRIKMKILTNSNLKSINEREIHVSVLEELFGKNRKPNLNNVTKVIKWVKNQQWDWIGNIVPSNTHPYEIKFKMELVFNRLKRKKRGHITLFYSIEENTRDSYYHSHFLIKDTSKCLTKKEILETLELITEENTQDETRIHLKAYDQNKYGNRGSSYSIKQIEFGYDILN